MSGRIQVATRKGLFTVERTDGKWSVANTSFTGDNVSIVLTDPRDGMSYAALDHGHFGVKLHRKAVEGTWEECPAPAYPEKPEGENEVDMWGKPLPWTTVRIWALEAGGPDERGVLWCGTLPGGLFRSSDHGETWQLMRSLWDHPKRKSWMGGGADLPGIHSICVDPRDSRCVRVGVSCGGMWMTADGGASWEVRAKGMYAAYMPPEQKFEQETQDPHRIVQCAAAPDRMWAQHHNGIFHTHDGGANWQEATNAKPSSFGFAVAVHPEEPDTAWFVPGESDQKRVPPLGQVVVSRTRDGGETFDVLRRGLPQQHAYDIVYRHALDVDETGNTLVIGSTSGGLWVSEDQGDSWQSVAQHLPPIYCVRFDPRAT